MTVFAWTPKQCDLCSRDRWLVWMESRKVDGLGMNYTEYLCGGCQRQAWRAMREQAERFTHIPSGSRLTERLRGRAS